MGILNIQSVARSLCAVLNIGDTRSTYGPARTKGFEAYDKLEKPVWLTTYLHSIKDTVSKVYESVIAGEPNVPNEVNGNHNMYRFITSLSANSMKIPVPQFIKTSYKESRMLIAERSIDLNIDKPAYLLGESGKPVYEEFINCRKMESFIYKLTGTASSMYMNLIHSPPTDLEIMIGLKPPATAFPQYSAYNYDCCRIHDLIFVHVSGEVFVGHISHYKKVCEFFLGLSSIIEVLQYIPIRITYSRFVHGLISVICKIGLKYPEYVGEAIKAARNICVISQDTDNIMDSKNELLIEMGEKKVTSANCFIEFFVDTFKSSKDIVNFSHIYKLVLHPDIDLDKSFAKLKGLVDGTVIDESTEQIYEYNLRKRLYIAAKQAGYDCRLVPYRGDRDLISNLNRATVTVDSVKKIDPIKFIGSKFQVITAFQNPELFVLQPSSKSSAPHSESTLNNIREFDKIKGRMMFTRSENVPNPKPVNDVETTLKDIDELKGEPAFARFTKLVKTYELFEAQFPGKTPEEIHPDDIIKLFDENPDLPYLVLTEPKLGEKHKELTRMFYMGEQALKAVTTRIERIAKQLTRKQMGVSITKSYQNRKGDLEQMADSMLRVKEGFRNLFVSFDLSSFSMKYPHQLLRAYGKILSEMTGCDALRRLDLLFKCSVVVHNTRGFKSSLPPVRGAFEGFLNFVWTSSHAVILEIALEEANVNGSMLTYSDDGLLKMVLPDTLTKDEVRAIAKKIQDVYSRHGLEFNFSKTMCSERIWEYLGEICIEGTLTPTYSKELCSFGSIEDSGDLELVTTRFMTYISQASALAKAGCPAPACEFLAMYQSMSSLVRIFPDIPVDAIKALLLVPIESGGLRIPTALELSSISSVTSISEFIADLNLISESSPKLAGLISTFIYENLPDNSLAPRTILMGETFPSSKGRLDGREIKNWLVDKLRSRLGSVVPQNPLTETRLSQLALILRTIDDINPKVISKIIDSTPQMQTYLEFCDNVTKSGALRLMKPVEILLAMRKDKKMLQSRLQNLRSLCSRRIFVTKDELIDEVFSHYYSEYELGVPKLSLRCCIRKALPGEEPDVTVLFDLTPTNEEHSVIADLNYTEPSMSNASPVTSSIWSEHVSKSIELKDQRKYAAFIASVLVSSPELGDALSAISLVFGIRIPSVPQELFESVERIRRSKGKGEDITLFGERVLRARSIMRFSERIMRFRDGISSLDFTTLPDLLRLHACHILTSSGIYHTRPSMSVVRLPFIILNDNMFRNNEMKVARNIDYSSIPDAPELSARLKDEYKSQILTVLNESKASCILRELHNYTPEEVKEMSSIATEVWVADLSDWISRMAINEYHAGSVLPALMPIVPFSNPDINRKAIHEGIFKIMKYDRKIARLNSEQYFVTQSTTHFEMSYCSYYSILESAGIILPSIDEIYSLYPTLEDDYKIWVESQSVLKDAILPIAVIDSRNCQASQATAVRVKAIKSMVEATQEHIFHTCSKNNWDSDLSSRELNLKGIIRIDDLLNVISIVTPLMRKSEHRSASHPYNKIMAEIELAKFIQFGIKLTRLLTNIIGTRKGITNESIDDAFNYIESEGLLGEGLSGYLLDYFDTRFKTGDGGELSHVDHIRCLNTPMYPSAFSRLKSFVKYNFRVGNKFPYQAEYNEITSLLTFFYESILKKCVNRLRIYSPSFREVVAEEASSIGQVSIRLLQPDLGYGKFYGTLRREMSNTECRAAFGCFLLTTTKLGGYEFQLNEPLPNRLGSLLENNLFLPEEVRPHMPVLSLNSDNSPSFFCIDTTTIEDVVRITTYITSARSGQSIAYLSSSNGPPKYTVIGYSHSSGPKMTILQKEVKSSFEYLNTLPPDSELLSSSLSEWATNTITTHGYHLLPSSSEGTPLKRTTDLALFKNSDIFHVGKERIIVDDKLLGLACVISSGVPVFREKVISYMLIKKWLESGDVDNLKILEHEFRENYNKKGLPPNILQEHRMRILNDIEETVSWAKMSRITASFEARKKFHDLYLTFESVECKLNIETKPRLPGVINPYLMVNLHRPLKVSIPEVSQCLYITSEAPPEEDF